jgi:hypothetical protein
MTSRSITQRRCRVSPGFPPAHRFVPRFWHSVKPPPSQIVTSACGDRWHHTAIDRRPYARGPRHALMRRVGDLHRTAIQAGERDDPQQRTHHAAERGLFGLGWPRRHVRSLGQLAEGITNGDSGSARRSGRFDVDGVPRARCGTPCLRRGRIASRAARGVRRSVRAPRRKPAVDQPPSLVRGADWRRETGAGATDERRAIQSFHVVHAPPDVVPGVFTYSATAPLSAGGSTVSSPSAFSRRPSRSSSSRSAASWYGYCTRP